MLILIFSGINIDWFKFIFSIYYAIYYVLIYSLFYNKEQVSDKVFIHNNLDKFTLIYNPKNFNINWIVSP